MATARQPDNEVSLSLLTKHDKFFVEQVPAPYNARPEVILERKIRHLARLLNCTEEEATHHFFHNL
jgi:hypothetical protein